MRSKPASCEGCACHHHGTDFSQVEGTGSLSVMIVAEASGEMEARDQLPLRPYAPAGSLLERTFRRMGYSRQQFSLTNCIRCRPKNNWLAGSPWEYLALNRCRPNLDAAIRERRPRAILALGDTALRELTGEAGEARGVSHLAGYVLPTYQSIPEPCCEEDCIRTGKARPDCFVCGGTGYAGTKNVPAQNAIPVIPTFHPAYIRRGKASHQGLFARNLQRAVNVAAGKDREWEWDLEEAQRNGRIRYQVHPSLDDAERFALRVAENRGLTVCYDLETFESASLDEDARDGFTDTRIRLIQFSVGRGEAIAFPWEGRYREIAATILRSDNVKCGHHVWLFDNKVLEACGEREGIDLRPRGPIHDTLAMYHHWQPDLPAHLQFAAQFVQFPFPWKHLAATDLEFYGCLTGESRVMCVDGPKKIEDIVRNRESALVWGMDENGDRIQTRVVGWRRIRVLGQKWLRIKAGGVDQPLYLTPDHEVWVVNGHEFARAEDLKVGDCLQSSRCGDAELLLGTLLGDASCDERGRFRFTHSEKQRDWFEAKRAAVDGPVYPPSVVKPRVIRKGCKPTGSGLCYSTEIWVDPKRWRKNFYDDKRRKLFRPPTDKALAVWYCDDGCWAVSSKSRARGWVGNPRIVLQGFANLNTAIRWFQDEFGIANVSFYPDKRSAQGGSIALIGDGRDHFFSRICRYVHPSMERKLPLQYRGKYDGWMDKPRPQEIFIESIQDYDPGPRNRNYRYCITVDHPTHRFFAMGGLVKNCVDVDATLRLYTFLDQQLRRDGIYDSPYEVDGSCVGGYIGQVAQVRPILAAMERRGLPVDDTERLKLDGEFDLAQQELAGELWKRAPEDCRRVHPKEGYKGVPPQVKPLDFVLWGGSVAPFTLSDANGPILFKEPDSTKEDGTVEEGEWYVYQRRSFTVKGIGEANGEPCVTQEVVDRWCRLYQFNPNSAPQLIAYMKSKGHKVPKSREQDEEGNGKETTAKKELVRLAHRSGDDFYLKVIEYRELSKMRGTYIEGFKPHADGRVHTTFTFDTGIGQLSSRNPNIQNFPKHGRLAKAVRRMIAAEPGHLFVDWDYKSCHVLTLGFLAEDANYIRCARIDMHSIVTGHKLGLWHAINLLRDHSDAEIKAKCKWLKSNPEWKHIRDARMKHAILGIGNGLKARGLYEKHMEDFSSQKEAQGFLDVVEELFPKVFAWHKWVQQLAHDQTFLKTQYGHMRRFYEVFVWNYKKAAYGHGDQAEEAISYWLSNIAFGYIREHMKLLEAAGLNEKYGLCDNVHDALSFHIREDQLDGHLREVYPILITPSKVLTHPMICPEGLWIDAEANAGKNWADMTEVAIPKAEVACV